MIDFLIEEVQDCKQIQHPELREMALKIQTPDTTELIALTENGVETGFISIEDFKVQHFANFVEVQNIFVLASFRRRGIGSLLLEKAEELSCNKGFAFIRLKAWPIEDGLGIQGLTNWYLRRGYLGSESSEWLEKRC